MRVRLRCRVHNCEVLSTMFVMLSSSRPRSPQCRTSKSSSAMRRGHSDSMELFSPSSVSTSFSSPSSVVVTLLVRVLFLSAVCKRSFHVTSSSLLLPRFVERESSFHGPFQTCATVDTLLWSLSPHRASSLVRRSHGHVAMTLLLVDFLHVVCVLHGFLLLLSHASRSTQHNHKHSVLAVIIGSLWRCSLEV